MYPAQTQCMLSVCFKSPTFLGPRAEGRTGNYVTGLQHVYCTFYIKSFYVHYLIWSSQQACEVGRENTIRFTLQMKLGFREVQWLSQLLHKRQNKNLLTLRPRALFSKPHNLWEYDLTSNIFTTSISFSFSYCWLNTTKDLILNLSCLVYAPLPMKIVATGHKFFWKVLFS